MKLTVVWGNQDFSPFFVHKPLLKLYIRVGLTDARPNNTAHITLSKSLKIYSTAPYIYSSLYYMQV